MNEIERVAAGFFESKGCRVHSKGWPDLLVETPERNIAIEIKYGKDMLRPEQESMHRALRRTMPVYVVRFGVPDSAGDMTIHTAWPDLINDLGLLAPIKLQRPA